jgi:hypothetical protein
VACYDAYVGASKSADRVCWTAIRGCIESELGSRSWSLMIRDGCAWSVRSLLSAECSLIADAGPTAKPGQMPIANGGPWTASQCRTTRTCKPSTLVSNGSSSGEGKGSGDARRRRFPVLQSSLHRCTVHDTRHGGKRWRRRRREWSLRAADAAWRADSNQAEAAGGADGRTR